MSLIQDAQPVFYILLVIMFLFSLGSIYFDSVIGLGKTLWGFYVKLITSASYLVLLYFIVEYTDLGLKAAWGTEVLYWVIVFAFAGYYLFYTKWKRELAYTETS